MSTERAQTTEDLARLDVLVDSVIGAAVAFGRLGNAGDPKNRRWALIQTNRDALLAALRQGREREAALEANLVATEAQAHQLAQKVRMLESQVETLQTDCHALQAALLEGRSANALLHGGAER